MRVGEGQRASQNQDKWLGGKIIQNAYLGPGAGPLLWIFGSKTITGWGHERREWKGAVGCGWGLHHYWPRDVLASVSALGHADRVGLDETWRDIAAVSRSGRAPLARLLLIMSASIS